MGDSRTLYVIFKVCCSGAFACNACHFFTFFYHCQPLAVGWWWFTSRQPYIAAGLYSVLSAYHCIACCWLVPAWTTPMYVSFLWLTVASNGPNLDETRPLFEDETLWLCEHVSLGHIKSPCRVSNEHKLVRNCAVYMVNRYICMSTKSIGGRTWGWLKLCPIRPRYPVFNESMVPWPALGKRFLCAIGWKRRYATYITCFDKFDDVRIYLTEQKLFLLLLTLGWRSLSGQ